MSGHLLYVQLTDKLNHTHFHSTCDTSMLMSPTTMNSLVLNSHKPFSFVQTKYDSMKQLKYYLTINSLIDSLTLTGYTEITPNIHSVIPKWFMCRF